MSGQIKRREFLKKSAVLSAATVLGNSVVPGLAFSKNAVDIAVVKGQNYFNTTLKAVELLGGMEKFVPPRANVAILANPAGNNPGTFTKPEIVQAVIQMCKGAGANKIRCIGWLPLINWQNTGLKKIIDSEGVDLEITDAEDESLFKSVPVPKGVSLKEAWIIKTLDQYDVLINVPIIKEHSGNNFSGTMKNLMGLNSPQSDQTFHCKDWTLLRDDIQHLDQCIADLNTVIHPNLCVVDATIFLASNGPFGPGKLNKPLKVIAGTDRVAIETYCAGLFGYQSGDIMVIRKAREHGLGEMDLSRINIKEVEI